MHRPALHQLCSSCVCNLFLNMKPGACPMLPFCSRRSTAGVGPLGLHRDRGTIYQQLATARMDTSGGARKGGRADSPSMKSFDFEVFGKVCETELSHPFVDLVERRAIFSRA